MIAFINALMQSLSLGCCYDAPSVYSVLLCGLFNILVCIYWPVVYIHADLITIMNKNCHENNVAIQDEPIMIIK